MRDGRDRFRGRDPRLVPPVARIRETRRAHAQTSGGPGPVMGPVMGPVVAAGNS